MNFEHCNLTNQIHLFLENSQKEVLTDSDSLLCKLSTLNAVQYLSET